MPKRLTPAMILAAGLALGLGACGSSKLAGVALAPSAGLTAASTTASTPTTPTTPSTPTATTPAPKVPPQLSKEPVIKVPAGAPPSHLVSKDLISGTGATASSGSTITVNYVGALYKGGKVFDSSWSRHQPFSTTLSASSVIPGWVQGLAGMKVGGRRELVIPPALGYGKTGQPPTIPGNSTLIFVVDLLSVG